MNPCHPPGTCGPTDLRLQAARKAKVGDLEHWRHAGVRQQQVLGLEVTLCSAGGLGVVGFVSLWMGEKKVAAS